MKPPRFLVGLLATLLAIGAAATSAIAQTAANLYQRIEQTMTNSTSFSNPFTDTELRLSVTAPSGRPLGSSFTWYGFHDGNGNGGQNGNVWKFRLLFDHPGLWTVNAGFYQPGTNNANGPSQTFQYNVSSTPVAGERGHIRLDPLNPTRFIHDDGTHWVPFSIHSGMLLDRASSVSTNWINQHAALGVNAMGVRFHSEVADEIGDPGQYHFLLKNGGGRATAWPGNANAFDYDRYDVAAWRHNEQAIDYAHSKGIKLFIWFGISGKNRQYKSYGPLDHSSDGQTLGAAQQRFIRYFLARWATHPAWWHWTVDSEWEETNGSNPSVNATFQRTYATALRTQNPWRTLVSNHSLTNWTLGNASDGWSLATIQRRITDSDNNIATQGAGFIEANDHFGMPTFNVEGVWNMTSITRSRVSTLNHFFAGGFSHIAHLEGTIPVPLWSWAVNWNTVIQHHKDDAAVIGTLAKFFNRADMDLNLATPAHSLVTVSTGSRYCLAQPGQLYAVWVTHGGTVSLNLSGVSGTFNVTRYAGASLPANGGGTDLGNVTGGGTVSLGTTPNPGLGNDYLFIVRNVAQGPTITVTSPNGGETWSAGGTALVTWTSNAFSGNVTIELSTNNGSSWTALKSNIANDGSENVTVPSTPTTTARIRVRAASGGTPSDTSNGAFTISAAADTTPPTLSITAPANNTTHGPAVTFTGTASDSSGVARVEYRVAGGSWITASGTTSWSFTLTGQSSGTRTIDVRAIDASSNANASGIVSRSLTFDATSPTITNIQASATSNSATITWTTNEIADSRVQYGTSSGVWDNETGVVQTGVTNHTVALSSLAASQTYYYIIITTDPYGNSAVSSERTFTTSSGSGVPAAPTNFSVTSASATSLLLTWTDNSGNETGFTIERKVVSSGSAPTVTLVNYAGTQTAPTAHAANSTQSFQVGALQANDRTDIWTSVPSSLNGATRLLTARMDRMTNPVNALYTVHLSGPGKIYLTLEGRYGGQKLSWMGSEWTDSGLTAATSSSGAGTWRLWERTVTAASNVTLGVDTAQYNGVTYVFTGTGGGTSETWQTVATVGANVTSYTHTGLTTGTTYTYRVRANGSSGNSSWSTEAFGVPGSTENWTGQDIGGVGAPGSSSYNSSTDTFTIQASGVDIYGNSDEFRYVTLDGGMQGDGEIIARVASITNTNSWAKAGIMMRDGLAANARNVAVLVSPNNQASFQYRSTAGAATTTATFTNLGAPRWLRLVRSGNTFTGYHSANGTSWTQIGTVNISLPTNLQIGLSVTSHNDGTLTTAVIDGVDVTP